MNHAEEATKVAKNTRFAILTRQLADDALQGQDTTAILAELAALRAAEHASADRITTFAAIGRQLGDAHRACKDTSQLTAAAVSLRRIERGPSPRESQP